MKNWLEQAQLTKRRGVLPAVAAAIALSVLSLPVRGMAQGGIQPFVERTDAGFSVDSHGSSVADVLTAVGQQAGFTVIASDGNRPPIDVSYENLPLDQILRKLLRDENYVIVYRGGKQSASISGEAIERIFLLNPAAEAQPARAGNAPAGGSPLAGPATAAPAAARERKSAAEGPRRAVNPAAPPVDPEMAMPQPGEDAEADEPPEDLPPDVNAMEAYRQQALEHEAAMAGMAPEIPVPEMEDSGPRLDVPSVDVPPVVPEGFGLSGGLPQEPVETEEDY